MIETLERKQSVCVFFLLSDYPDRCYKVIEAPLTGVYLVTTLTCICVLKMSLMLVAYERSLCSLKFFLKKKANT